MFKKISGVLSVLYLADVKRILRTLSILFLTKVKKIAVVLRVLFSTEILLKNLGDYLCVAFARG